MYIVHCGTGTLWFGRSLKSSCPPDSWELMENLEQTISSHSRFWRFWSQCWWNHPQSGRRRCVGEELGKALVFLTLASVLRLEAWPGSVVFFFIQQLSSFYFCFPGRSHQPWSRAILGREGFTDLPSLRQTTQFHLHLVSFLVIRECKYLQAHTTWQFLRLNFGPKLWDIKENWVKSVFFN